jgi:hypothetical protein
VYVKTTKRDNKSGTVRYLHLAHNVWDPVKGRAIPKVLFTFGREDDLDRDAIKRLVGSLSRLLDPADALVAAASGTELAFVSSRAFGGAHRPRRPRTQASHRTHPNLLTSTDTAA